MKIKQEISVIHDNGGSRSGRERRQSMLPFQGKERRSGKERRRGIDRRSGLTRRTRPDRRAGKYWDGSCIERRDAFRAKLDKSS